MFWRAMRWHSQAGLDTVQSAVIALGIIECKKRALLAQNQECLFDFDVSEEKNQTLAKCSGIAQPILQFLRRICYIDQDGYESLGIWRGVALMNAIEDCK